MFGCSEAEQRHPPRLSMDEAPGAGKEGCHDELYKLTKMEDLQLRFWPSASIIKYRVNRHNGA